MKKIKYLHLMTHPAMFFNGNVIEMINNNSNDFNSDEHIFIVGYIDIFEKYKAYNNVIFIPKIMTRNYMKFLKCCNNAEFVFLHQNWFYDFVRLIFTPLKIRRKYIWCVWGHDLYTNHGKAEGTKECVKLIIRKLGDFLIDIESRWYRGIGIGFKYDSLEIKKRFKNKIDIFLCPYPIGTKISVIKSIAEEQWNNVENKKLKIMVGHSAHQYLHHIDILERLSIYKDKNILISIPLVYGNNNYAIEVEKVAKRIFGEKKVEVLRERLEKYDYIRYIKSVDILIADQLHQSGLGNIYYAMYLKKKIFLNPNGILRQIFLLEGIDFSSTNELGVRDMNSLTNVESYFDRGYDFANFILDERTWIDMWKSTLNSLSNK